MEPGTTAAAIMGIRGRTLKNISRTVIKTMRTALISNTAEEGAESWNCSHRLRTEIRSLIIIWLYL